MLKKLIEQRAMLIEELETGLELIEKEERTFNEEELEKRALTKTKIEGLDKTIKEIEDAEDKKEKRKIKLNDKNDGENEEEKRAMNEERAFSNYIRGIIENRADVNLTVAANGAVIPQSIANKIIQKVEDISPIYQLATRYNVGGALTIPYYDKETTNITMAYSDEFTELESTSGKFTNITLNGFLAGALSKVSISLVNNSQFNLTSFVISAMAVSIAKWLEGECLNGTTDKIDGLKGVTLSKTAAAAAAVTADELIDTQELIPDVYQANAIWIMNKATRTAIRKLKDGQGNYLLNKDATSRWGYTLFDKDVYTSDNVDAMAIDKTAIYYGDMSGLALKVVESMNIQVLREKYATQHAIGVVAWMELDAKIENAQKIAKLVMAAA